MKLHFVNLHGQRSFEYGVSCNQDNGGWRRRLAQRLRRLAQRLDGRRTLGLEFTSSERLSHGSATEVVQAGLDHMLRHMCELTRLAAVEQMMAEQRPDLVDTPQ